MFKGKSKVENRIFCRRKIQEKYLTPSKNPDHQCPLAFAIEEKQKRRGGAKILK
jgi:hypothetical protein